MLIEEGVIAGRSATFAGMPGAAFGSRLLQNERRRASAALEIPQVAVDAVAAEIAALRHSARAALASGSDRPVANGLLAAWGTDEIGDQTALAGFVAAAYNSPDILQQTQAELDTVGTDGVVSFANARFHAVSAAAHAALLRRTGLFR